MFIRTRILAHIARKQWRKILGQIALGAFLLGWAWFLQQAIIFNLSADASIGTVLFNAALGVIFIGGSLLSGVALIGEAIESAQLALQPIGYQDAPFIYSYEQFMARLPESYTPVLF